MSLNTLDVLKSFSLPTVIWGQQKSIITKFVFFNNFKETDCLMIVVLCAPCVKERLRPDLWTTLTSYSQRVTCLNRAANRMWERFIKEAKNLVLVITMYQIRVVCCFLSYRDRCTYKYCTMVLAYKIHMHVGPVVIIHVHGHRVE